jgi:hypothetical protein
VAAVEQAADGVVSQASAKDAKQLVLEGEGRTVQHSIPSLLRWAFQRLLPACEPKRLRLFQIAPDAVGGKSKAHAVAPFPVMCRHLITAEAKPL